jgi:hypothetical protein
MVSHLVSQECGGRIMTQRQVKRLAALTVQSLKRPGLHPDGDGLYFQITPGGSRSWLYRYMLHGTRRAMGLGA